MSLLLARLFLFLSTLISKHFVKTTIETTQGKWPRIGGADKIPYCMSIGRVISSRVKS